MALIYWRTILFADGFLMNQKAYSEMFRASCSRAFFFFARVLFKALVHKVDGSPSDQVALIC